MYRFMVPVLISFMISAVSGHFAIPILHRLKFGQTERELGVKAHLKKTGTPTMGGVFFVAALIITAAFYAPYHKGILPVLLLTAAFGLIGFLDDYLKVVLKSSDGLLAWQKMGLQILVTCVFAFYMVRFSGIPLTLLIPFRGGYCWDIGWAAIPLLFIVVIGTVNGTNFTDGLDGLASSVTIVVAGFFAVASWLRGGSIEPMAGAVAGALMGFLLYNAYPAKVFMGDTGSLALGGFVAGTAYILQMPVFLLIVGFIYLIEVISVMLQVIYFKKTGGKRLFKMAPIHHHFELCGWSEARVVTVFTIITALLCAIAVMGI